MLSSTNSSLANVVNKKYSLPASKPKQIPTCKLFVGNLATQTTGSHLQTIFHSYGHVIECVKVRERYGFVRFSSSDEAQRALNACHGLQLNGYPMMVEYAQNEILISPKSSRKLATSKTSFDDQENALISNRTNHSKRFPSSNLNPDASSFQYACSSTSDYYSQSERPSSRSSSTRSNCLSPSLISTLLPSSYSVDDDKDDENPKDEQISQHEQRIQRNLSTEKRSSLNLFIGDQILNLYGSNLNNSKNFNGRDIDPRDPIFIWNFAFYPDVSMNPFVKRTDIKTLLERRVSLYSQS